ncbi:MAG TPA: hypothetical protein VMF08_13595 [Candidatus Sulfotelmatobacter sp.]|nr:hypothetical protein [Candidatus Sulfotelmatobacter sp.]
MNATELTEFFLKHRGERTRPRVPQDAPTRPCCFGGWQADKIFSYVLVHCVRRNVFAARDRCGHVAFAAIAWLDDAARIKDLDARGLSQFEWEPEHPQGWTPNGDSILIADVAGDRRFMPEILKQVTARWPEAPRRRLFTYRRGKLVELNWQTILRFGSVQSVGSVRSDESRPTQIATAGGAATRKS